MEVYMTTTNGKDAPDNREDAFMDGLVKLTGILSGVAEKLDDLAESFSTSEEEIAELNAGKTEEEIIREDAIAAQIVAPLVNALDSISTVLNSATKKIMEMSTEKR